VTRKAQVIRYSGFVFVPKDGPSKFTIGPGAWLKDEGDLLISTRASGNEIWVSAPDDPQIMFPSPEVWVRASNRYEHLLRDDLVDG